ncbi:MAG: DUF2069 domain-containing protein [Gammaproteobacteria bacterium]|jgi:uncharacterized membrane protein|nr:DUF2069 domain-containing protein [Gammaproteobacteria bacterium]MBT3724795.1 DUF2069 domain-containing protein [Gammaproteobacteria bacterium]MBT4078449.1 DUF2069 domain-containing protein [Gammaproteobacteria bacterium]MBT4194512.1 DUF2069 domain-containing protein [Gammaproteobacteria bacterium]MBT4449749.1 DUF2069 domain-containing protein [Gammaproteobacteria bacterium]
MSIHPLKLVSLISIIALIGCQTGLIFLLDNDYRYLISTMLTAPLLIPLKGLFANKRYTFKWIGFLTMLYFSIGVSESFANPDLQIYGALNILLSGVLFVSSIYYSRYLRQLEQTKD